MAKIHVAVIALYSDHIYFQNHKIPVSSKLLAEHKVIPLKIMTEYGDTLIIDKITDIRREASTKAGGLGDRYTCLATHQMDDIQKQIYVYKDDDEWYMEDYF